MEGVNPHLYGKSTVKPHRKMGHITVTGLSMEGPKQIVEASKISSRNWYRVRVL